MVDETYPLAKLLRDAKSRRGYHLQHRLVCCLPALETGGDGNGARVEYPKMIQWDLIIKEFRDTSWQLIVCY